MSDVIRIGNFMYRKSGPWSQQIQQFLQYLHKQGFHSVPKPFGFDEYGREIVDLMIERLQTLVNFLIKSAKDGNKKYILNFQDKHHIKYINDLKYIKSNKLFIEEMFQN